VTTCQPDTELRWSCVTKGVDETFPATLSAFGMCALYWSPNEQYEIGEFIWPTKPDGFVLECTTAGRSGSKEPRWKSVGVDQPMNDGSAIFTLRVPTLTSGVQAIGDPRVGSMSPATGLEVTGLVVSENTKILVDYTGGEAGKSYTVRYTFVIAGRLRQGSQVVHVVANK
jgi:hypothetical protein